MKWHPNVGNLFANIFAGIMSEQALEAATTNEQKKAAVMAIAKDTIAAITGKQVEDTDPVLDVASKAIDIVVDLHKAVTEHAATAPPAADVPPAPTAQADGHVDPPAQ